MKSAAGLGISKTANKFAEAQYAKQVLEGEAMAAAAKGIGKASKGIGKAAKAAYNTFTEYNRKKNKNRYYKYLYAEDKFFVGRNRN